MAQDMFDRLDDEWHRVVRTPAAHRALDRWCGSGICPPVVDSLEDLVELIRCGGTDGREVAHCLVEVARGDGVAARVVLQVVLPSLVRLARRSGLGDPEAPGTIVGLAWIMIRTYPSHRPGDVAANLAWDIRKHYLRSRRDQEYPLGQAAPEAVAPSAETVALDRLGVDELRSVLDRLSGSALPFEVLWSTRVEGRSSIDVARGCGLSRHGLVQRRRRAEQALRGVLSA